MCDKLLWVESVAVQYSLNLIRPKLGHKSQQVSSNESSRRALFFFASSTTQVRRDRITTRHKPRTARECFACLIRACFRRNSYSASNNDPDIRKPQRCCTMCKGIGGDNSAATNRDREGRRQRGPENSTTQGFDQSTPSGIGRKTNNMPSYLPYRTHCPPEVSGPDQE